MEEDRLDIPSESANLLLVDLQIRLAEVKEATALRGGCEGVKSRQEISQDISSAMKRQRQMPQHFIELNDRVEAVWNMLRLPNQAVVALVGMGGIGEEGLEPEQLRCWTCVCLHCGFVHSNTWHLAGEAPVSF